MELTIEVPEQLVERAAELGIPVRVLIDRALEEIARGPVPEGFVRLGPATMTPKEATAGILEIQRKHTLGGLKIKDLIEEGRRL